MQRTKIISILSSFDEHEWRACKKYIKYCNKQEANGVKLFEYIFRFRKKLDSPKLSRNSILKKVLPDLNEKALLNLFSHTTSDIESFIVHREIESQHRYFERNKILAEVYKKKGTYKLFESKLSTLTKQLDKLPDLDLFKNLKKIQLYHLHYFSDVYEKNSRPVELLRLAEESRVSFNENLELFYKIESNNLKSLFNVDNSFTPRTTPNELALILKNLNNLVTNRDDEGFNYLEKCLFDNQNKMTQEIAQPIILHLINHCLFEIKSGRVNKFQNLTSLYLFGLESKTLLYGGKLSEVRFLTIIEVISRSKEKYSAKIFISKWIDYVETREKKSVEHIAFAHWYFALEKYDDALSHISHASIVIINLNLSLRIRWIKICSLFMLYPSYEYKEEIIDSAYVFFRRNKSKLNKATYEGSLNLVKFVEQAWNNTPLVDLKKYIEECDYLIFRTWLNQLVKKPDYESGFLIFGK